VTKYHGKDTVVFAGGYDITTYCNEASISVSAETADVSTFGDSWIERIAGMKDGSLDLSGIWEAGTGSIDERMSAYLGLDGVQWTVGYGGTTIGNSAKVLVGIATSYEPAASIGDAVSWSATVDANGGIYAGVFLHEKASAAAAANFTVVNNGAASSAGLVANQHTTAVTGTPNAVWKIQESSDNAGDAYADVITFTGITGIGSEQKTTTAAVEQYLRARLNAIDGATAVTTTIAVARK
jgi:hypothetical protein